MKENIAVIDTSVLLDDYRSILKIPDERIVIPLPVLDELDKKKENQDEIGRNARSVNRFLDSQQGDISKGVQLESGSILQVLDSENGSRSKPIDERIIQVASDLQSQNGNVVRILSQDIGMKVRAKGRGISAFSLNQENAKAEGLEEAKRKIYSGVGEIDLSQEDMNEFFGNKIVYIEEYEKFNEYFYNQFLVIKGAYKKGSSDCIGIVKKHEGKKCLKPIVDYRNMKKKYGFTNPPKNIEQNLSINLMLDREIHSTTLLGVAGTGKTLMALECALHELDHNDDIDCIILTKPMVPVGKSFGFLPGSVEEKFNPWLGSLFDNLRLIMKHKDDLDICLEQGVIRIEPIELFRGRSISNSIIIVDELQNCSKNQAKTIFTRAGQNTKIFATADIDQIDDPYLDYFNNGATHCIERFKNSDLIGHVTLREGERSKLAALSANVL